jgi:chromosomal replication initiator protein
MTIDQTTLRLNELEKKTKSIIACRRAVRKLLKEEYALRSAQVEWFRTMAHKPEFRIIAMVAEEFRITPEQMIGPTRPSFIAHPRLVAMRLIYEEVKLPLGITGNIFGGRHHTSVIYAIEKVSDLCDTEPAFKATYERLRERANAIIRAANGPGSDFDSKDGSRDVRETKCV